MKINDFKNTFLAAMLLTTTSFANAALVTIELDWNGFASGTLTADESLINTGGTFSNLHLDPSTVFSIITPNGTYTHGDLEMRWNVEGTTALDLSTGSELFGQTLSTGDGFGMTNGSGKFHLFGNYGGPAFNTLNGCDGEFAICFNRTGQSPHYLSSAIVTQGSANVPEPTTLAIFALGFLGLASRRFKKQA
jgi:hypothetical protein